MGLYNKNLKKALKKLQSKMQGILYSTMILAGMYVITQGAPSAKGDSSEQTASDSQIHTLAHTKEDGDGRGTESGEGNTGVDEGHVRPNDDCRPEGELFDVTVDEDRTFYKNKDLSFGCCSPARGKLVKYEKWYMEALDKAILGMANTKGKDLLEEALESVDGGKISMKRKCVVWRNMKTTEI